MYTILLSGGSGERLWPLSNEIRSKQFLKVLKDKNGNYESMIQRIFKQLKKSGMSENLVVSTNKNQAESIANQLGDDINIVIEPERRNTFPAITLACAFLFYERDIPKDEIIITLPSDSYVGMPYFETLKRLASQLDNFDIGLMGKKPEYPSEKYGYIIPDPKSDGVIKDVVNFKEKPDIVTAKKLIGGNALWNCGVFVFRLGYIIDILEKSLNLFDKSYSDVVLNYKYLNKKSFDYEVLERASKIAVIEYDGIWKDIGAWDTLTEHMDNSILGKSFVLESPNTHVINELDMPIVVSGVKNAVIAASPDGIIVTDKNNTGNIKDCINSFKKRPMYEERRWGFFSVLDFAKNRDNNTVITKRMQIFEGKNISYQVHRERNEIWTIISGNGEVVLGSQIINVSQGDVVKIAKGAKHSIRAKSDLEFIEVQIGRVVLENDVIRFAYDWDEIISFAKEKEN